MKVNLRTVEFTGAPKLERPYGWPLAAAVLGIVLVLAVVLIVVLVLAAILAVILILVTVLIVILVVHGSSSIFLFAEIPQA